MDVFGLSETGPISRDFGTKDQIRRSAFSISNNIAEGFEYDNNKDFIKFLRFAKGSAGELRSRLFVLKETELLDAIFYEQKKDELLGLSRQIKAFIEYLRKFEQDKQKTAPTKT